MGFRLQHKSMILNDMCYAYYGQTAEARVLRFSLIYKFDDEIRWESNRILSKIFD